MFAKLTLTLNRWADTERMTDKDLKGDFEWLVEEWVKGMQTPKEFEIEEWAVEVDEPRRREEG